MKTDRQKLILELISGQSVATQQQLLELLAARGVQCTQATLSRDIHALNLVKLSDPGGGIRYGGEPVSAVGNDVRKLLNIARLASLSIDAAGNIIVIKTMPGLAHAVGSFADKLEEQGLVGSIAGNDTILLIIRDNASAQALCRNLQELLLGEKGMGEKRAAGTAGQ